MLNIPEAPLSADEVLVPGTNRFSRRVWRFLVDLVAALKNRVPITGTATFAAATTATVTFATAEPDANYQVYFSAPDNKTYWASSKTTAGFQANASGSNSNTVGWQLIRA